MVNILTKKEIEIINKKLNYRKISQIESNRLSRSIRPKLKEMASIDANNILQKIEYNQKASSTEHKIVKLVLNNLKKVNSIIIYGSAIQTNYKEYNDIDIMIVTEYKIYKTEIDKIKKIRELKDILKQNLIKADIEIINKKNLIKSYPNSPTLIYQLKDHKIVYGKIKLPNKIEVYNIDLQMKLDWSKIYSLNPKGEEIYRALRNTVLVRLLMNNIIDNTKLRESLYEELGKNLIERLKNNQESKLDKKIALAYLKGLIEKTRSEIKGELWEKTVQLKQ